MKIQNIIIGLLGITFMSFTHNEEAISCILEKAETFIGTPYKYGGSTEKGFDCSGFVQASFKGIYDLPRNTKAQNKIGKTIPFNQRMEGDLIFFNTRSTCSHVGIVTKNGFIHASTSQGVIISPMSEYWRKRIHSVKRVL